MKKRAKHLATKTALVFPLRSADQAFIMALCLLTSIPVLFGDTPAPGSIDAFMPAWMVVCWSLVLAVGAGVVLSSYFFKERITGIIIEQFGSICIGVAATIYGVAIFAITWDQGGGIPGSIILGFAFARFYQAWQYQKFLDDVKVIIQKLEEGGGTNER